MSLRAFINTTLLQYLPSRSKAAKNLSKEIVSEVCCDVATPARPSPIIDEDFKRYQREVNRRESLVVEALSKPPRIKTCKTCYLIYLATMIECPECRMRERERAERIAEIYSKLEPHGA